MAFLRLADDDHLLLLELVDAVHAALLDAVRAHFLAEARGIAGQRLRQLVLGAGSVSMNLPIMECSDVPIR